MVRGLRDSGFWWKSHTRASAPLYGVTVSAFTKKRRSHIMGRSNVQIKGGKIPYVILVITTPGHITLEYRPFWLKFLFKATFRRSVAYLEEL